MGSFTGVPEMTPDDSAGASSASTGAGAGAHEGRRMARAAGLVGVLTLLSRVLGLAREFLFAVLLGAGFYSDAYQIAFRIPNLLRDLFAEGALSAAFVPTFTDYLTNRSQDEAYRLANRLMTTLVLLLGALVALGMIFAGPLVGLIGHGFHAVPGKEALCEHLTRIMLPFLPMASLAAVAMGMLNAQERFGVPAFASSLFNIVTIAAGVGFWALHWDPERTVVGWSAAVLAGGAAQFLVQVPPLRAQKWRYRPVFGVRDPGLRRIARLMAPATVGLAAVQINIVVNSIFASSEQGAVSWLSFAFRLLYLPIGIFGVAIGTIATTGLAKRAAEKDLPGMRRTLQHGLRLVGFLTIPSMIGLLVLARPIIRLIYEHGRFKPASTEPTAIALECYAVGLFAYSAVKVLAPAFYALDRPRVPLIGSAFAVTTNLLLNFSLYPVLHFKGVALGTSLGAIVNFTFLTVMFQRTVGGVRGGGLGRALFKVTLSALAMGAAAYGAASGLEHVLGVRGIVAKSVTCLVPMAAGVVVYGVAARLLGIEEMRDVMAMVKRKLRRA
jgi:putative peptidoglycan lipid II flippase